MTFATSRRLVLATVAGLALGASAMVPASAQTTLSLFAGSSDQALLAYTNALTAAFEKANPDIKIETEVGPGGTERDNMVKSRLATGTMNDLFIYNAGSLFQAINPTKTVVDLTNEPWQANILDSFKQTVTASDGTVRGVPFGVAMGGGILYNKPIYKELGLSIPKTWAEFMANNKKIKAAGKIPVIQTYGTSWTSQIFVLADYYNVQAEDPNFAKLYTENKAKFATTPAALRGFEYQADVYKASDLNKDFGAAVIGDGERMLATGEGANYPMLTFMIGVIGKDYPKKLNDIGFFPIPGDNPNKNGVTVWMPVSLYIAANSPHIKEAKRFAAFAASQEACSIFAKATTVTGPFLIKGCKLPDNVPPAVQDLASYFKTDGATAPALEFLSPVKGPNLENIMISVGSGIVTAKQGAAQYDEDVKKQALQLGLPGW